MKTEFNLSSHRLSVGFWETIFERCYERLPGALAKIVANYERCERFRTPSDSGTGSISVAAGVCLYLLCGYFDVRRVAEIGTFIGKSTTSMALALADGGPGGTISTCDQDNDCFRAWDGLGCEIRTFPGSTSTEMLATLDASDDKIDLFFIDGRLLPDDGPRIQRLSHPGTILAFDDFEGTEKGVVNTANIRPLFNNYFVIEPCPARVLNDYGIPGRSLTALLFNVANLRITNQ
jgi:predicted O-methyltransferase YrrM